MDTKKFILCLAGIVAITSIVIVEIAAHIEPNLIGLTLFIGAAVGLICALFYCTDDCCSEGGC